MTQNEKKTETVVISTPEGTVTTEPAATPAEERVLHGTEGGEERVLRGTESGEERVLRGAAAGGEQVLHAASPAPAEYHPVDYPDPGAVTEQFDQLATRDAETMETLPTPPHGSALEEVELLTEGEEEAVALSGASDLSGLQPAVASTRHASETVQEMAETRLRDRAGRTE